MAHALRGHDQQFCDTALPYSEAAAYKGYTKEHQVISRLEQSYTYDRSKINMAKGSTHTDH
jgi:hypothetical protein